MDARTRYTKMMVKNQFLLLLEEKPLDRITVKEICEMAQINRATFYKYYDNPFDLMDKLEKELIADLQEKIEEGNSKMFQDIFNCVLLHVKENEKFYRLVFDESSDTRFREELFSLCFGANMETINEKFTDMSDKEKEWLYYFIAEGCNGILKRWIDNGLQESIENIADFAKKLVTGINDLLPARFSA